jgi:DNA-binding IclR family transcriptional regulator
VADNATPTVKSADRALEVLEIVADAGSPLSLNDLASSMNIPKSSLHAIIRTMVQRQWLESEPSTSRVSLGLRALLVGSRYVEGNDHLASVQPVLDWLSAGLGETVHYGQLDQADIVYLAKRESVHPLRLYSAIGRRLPAHATALGKAILAQRTPSEVHAILPETLTSLTAHTITDMHTLDVELEKIRQQGYSVDNEENTEGLRCFAVPVLTGGASQYAVSFSIPIFRLTESMAADAVALLQQAQYRIQAQARMSPVPM